MTELDKIHARLSEIRDESYKLRNEERELVSRVDELTDDFRMKFAMWYYSDLDEDILDYFPKSPLIRKLYSTGNYERYKVIDFTDHHGEFLGYLLDYNEEEIEEMISKGIITSFQFQQWMEIAKDMYTEKFKKFTIDW